MTVIVQKRNAMLRELHGLRMKPRRDLEDEKRMFELECQVKEIMQEIGRNAKQNRTPMPRTPLPEHHSE